MLPDYEITGSGAMAVNGPERPSVESSIARMIVAAAIYPSAQSSI